MGNCGSLARFNKYSQQSHTFLNIDGVQFILDDRRWKAVSYSISTSEFGKMSKRQRAEAVKRLARGAFESSNGQAGEIDAQIDEYERKFGYNSRHLMELLIEGKLSETDEVSDWLWLLNFRRE